ncbi:hypothetical protein [Dyadobacter tibetensis]|uniref:hypothetical protein n=1 Tax=Dyadobacter tibetensis TaxID=1211851 RepID=UPI000472590D|nr:hypothetical protein [Dyadobacter tibetensis]
MTKRLFILFLSLLSFLATASLSFQGEAIKTMGGIDAREKQATEAIEFDHTYDDNNAILQADVSEWRENLNELLRHRGTSFRFIGIEQLAVNALYFGYAGPGNIVALGRQIYGYRSSILSDYYCFLHRLCPF